jgi:hypothetical protein
LKEKIAEEGDYKLHCVETLFVLYNGANFFIYRCNSKEDGETITKTAGKNLEIMDSARWFLARLIFDFEDSGDTFLRNAG